MKEVVRHGSRVDNGVLIFVQIVDIFLKLFPIAMTLVATKKIAEIFCCCGCNKIQKQVAMKFFSRDFDLHVLK